jgi:NAD(P)-dependent dehydrogenase (short-subunit alcohol dehydrogenase family)
LRATESTVRAFGRIDILVNNAARAKLGVVDEIDEDSRNETIVNNLTSVWRGFKCAAPHMRRQRRGSIINLSSVLASTRFHGYAAYSAAKGGINSLTQQAALDLAPAGIRVNAIAPGTIMTPLNQKILRSSTNQTTRRSCSRVARCPPDRPIRATRRSCREHSLSRE